MIPVDNTLATRSSTSLLALLAIGVAAATLMVAPIEFTEANGLGTCGGVLDADSLYKSPAGSPSALDWLLTTQRQNAICEDARGLRTAYLVGIVATAPLLVLAARRGKVVRVSSATLCLLVAMSAVLDGPLLPGLLAATAGGTYLLTSGRRTHPAETGVANRPPVDPSS